LHFKHFVRVAAVALSAAALSPTAFAQCAGFTDVVDDGTGATSFCPSVEWVKNRSITLGCSSTQVYCPNNNVTRLQMAAFMNRLGTALTPQFLAVRQTGAQLGAPNYSSVQTVCATGPVAPSGTGFQVTGYPRTAIVTGLLNLFTPDGPFDVEAKLVVSTDNGNSWAPALPAERGGFAYGSLYQTVPGTATLFAPPYDISLRPHTFFDLDVGSTYRFAIQGVRQAGTGDQATTYCELHVQIVNRNGASPPRDLSAESPGRGY
jgi:hypothetical protein